MPEEEDLRRIERGFRRGLRAPMESAERRQRRQGAGAPGGEGMGDVGCLFFVLLLPMFLSMCSGPI